MVIERCSRSLIQAGLSVTLLVAGHTAVADEADLLNAFSALQGHINGSTTLNASQIEANKLVLDVNRTIFGDSAASINASFNLVQSYEAQYGPMWSLGSPTQNGYSRRDTSNGDIHWTMFNAMQYIVDDTYNPTNIATHQNLLNGYKFGSADVIPGPVNSTPNPAVTHTVSIDGSFLNSFGRNTMQWADTDPNGYNPIGKAIKATGTYLAPGTIATLTVPEELVNSGYVVRVGAQSWDYSNRNPVRRLDRSAVSYDIDSTTIEIASPLGGNLYIDVPFEADAGVVDVQFQNIVRSPFFSMQDHHTTTVQEWQNTERNHLAPFADFQSEKYAMVVPTGWVYALDDPKTLMENWDKAMDVTNDLMGFDRDRGKESLRTGVDVTIKSGAYSPGYPSVNATFDPRRNQDASGWNTAGNADNGNSNNYLVTGPQNAASWEFHEMGHAYLFPKLPGETEAIVNLLHVAVMNQAFDQDLQTAFRTSRRGYDGDFFTTDTTAVTWMTSFNFFTRNAPMDKLEKQYQLKGHAKFVEVARLFGWEAIGDYYRSYNEIDDQNGGRYNTGIDGHLLALSEAVGEDITPLFHFWGVHPEDINTLQADLDAAGVIKSREVYALLQHYKTLVPEDNAEFRQHVTSWWGGEPDIEGYWTENEHARQWDETDYSGQSNGEGVDVPLQLPNGEMYTENSAALIRNTINDLMIEYYLEFMADLNSDETLDGNDWIKFITNAQADLSGMSADEALALGDFDGDMDNDLDDFILFRQAYEMAHPEPGAFEAMVAIYGVPEPTTGLLLLAGLLTIGNRRRRVQH